MLRLTNLRRALALRLGYLPLLALFAFFAAGPALASGGGGHGDDHGGHHASYTGDEDRDGIPNWRDPGNEAYVCGEVGFHTFNLMLFIGIIVYLARRPMMDTFRDRALDIRKGLTDSARQRDEAHQRHQEFVARLDAIEQEVAGMEAKAKTDAEAEEASLAARAEEAATRIAEQAERSIQDEARRARLALRKDAVELAVQLAETTLQSKVSTDDQQKLATEFLATLKGGDHGQ
ncbi:MAG: hypothetical protein AAGA48_34765 [Myxococcota bacterium]